MGASKDFPGSTDNVSVSSYSEIDNHWDLGGNISFWVYRNNSVANGRYLDKSDGPSSGQTDGWSIFSEGPNGNLRILQKRTTGQLLWQTDNGISLNEWLFVSINYDNSSTSNSPVFYVNSIEFAITQTSSGSGSIVNDSTFPLKIGNILNDDRPIDGKISHVHMYDRELTQAEIKEIMHKPGSIRDGLVGFWPLTDDGSTQRNLSGIGNTGAVTGATNSSDGPPVTCFK